MIITDLINLFFEMVKSLSYNDFTMTFFYIIILIIILKILRSLLWSLS